jgi:hypothetical protein
MKRTLLAAVLVTAALSFARPYVNWDEVSGQGQRGFSRTSAPDAMRGTWRHSGVPNQWNSRQRDNSRAGYQAYGQRGPGRSNMMQQRRGHSMQRFSPERFGQDRYRGHFSPDSRQRFQGYYNYTSPQRFDRFSRDNKPEDYRRYGQNQGRYRGMQPQRRGTFNTEQRRQGLESNEKSPWASRFNAPSHQGLRSRKSGRNSVKDECPIMDKKGRGEAKKQEQCPMQYPSDAKKAPSAQRHSREKSEIAHTREAEPGRNKAQTRQMTPEVRELKLKLRDSVMNADYKSAKRIINRLEDIDSK